MKDFKWVDAGKSTQITFDQSSQACCFFKLFYLKIPHYCVFKGLIVTSKFDLGALHLQKIHGTLVTICREKAKIN
jgi:hypothetical protein